MRKIELFKALYEATENEKVEEMDKELAEADAKLYDACDEHLAGEAVTAHELRGFILGFQAASKILK